MFKMLTMLTWIIWLRRRIAADADNSSKPCKRHRQSAQQMHHRVQTTCLLFIRIINMLQLYFNPENRLVGLFRKLYFVAFRLFRK